MTNQRILLDKEAGFESEKFFFFGLSRLVVGTLPVRVLTFVKVTSGKKITPMSLLLIFLT